MSEDKYLTILDSNLRILNQFSLGGRLTTPDLLGIRAMFRNTFPDIPEFRLLILSEQETYIYMDDTKREAMLAEREALRLQRKAELKEKYQRNKK